MVNVTSIWEIYINRIIDSIMQRGTLRCGVHSNRPGFAQLDLGSSMWEGLDVDYCTAVASSLMVDAVFIAVNSSAVVNVKTLPHG